MSKRFYLIPMLSVHKVPGSPGGGMSQGSTEIGKVEDSGLDTGDAEAKGFDGSLDWED